MLKFLLVTDVFDIFKFYVLGKKQGIYVKSVFLTKFRN